MQLLIAIIQDEDADLLSRRLTQAGFSHTRLNTVGGFLSRGNVTMLIGVQDDDVDQVLDFIRQTCHTRKRFISPMPAGAEPAHLTLSAPAFPLEVQVGGANVFFLPISRLMETTAEGEKLMNQPPTPTPSGEATSEAMNLVLAIVQNEAAEAVTRALIAAGRRVTRINTAGGFLRRGNVTLLVGVPKNEVDDVLALIGANTGGRTEPNPVGSGMPFKNATTFVLEASRFVRI